MLLAIDALVKGALVLAVAAVAARLLRRGPAASRYLVWCVALIGVLALPLLGSMLPSWQPSLMPEVPESWVYGNSLSTIGASRTSKGESGTGRMAPLPRPTPRAPAVVPTDLQILDGSMQAPLLDHGASGTADAKERAREWAERSRSLAAGSHVTGRDLEHEVEHPAETTTEYPASEAETQASPSLQRATLPANVVPTWPALLAGLYLCGAALLLLRLAVGAAGVLRMMRAAQPVADSPLRRDYESAVAELGIARDVRLLETDGISVPLAWELLRPAVVMPRAAHGWPRDRRRVALLHELAHVQRRDCQMQFAARVALALHWINPLAWLAVRRLCIEREHACDDAVLSLGARASDYADHLLHIARALLSAREPAWASVAMARSRQLEGRVAAILDPRNSRRLPQRRTTMTALITALALLLPLATLQPQVAAQSRLGSTPTPGEEPISGQLPEVVPTLPEEATGLPAEGDGLPETGTPLAELGKGELEPLPPGSVAPLPPLATQEAAPTIDELVQMRIHGVTTEFIEEVRRAFGRPVTVDELVQMRIHGTTPAFVRAIQQSFPDEDVTIRDVTNLRIHGASEAFIEEMADALGDDLTIRDITNLRIHEATPEFVRAMRDLLADQDISARDITTMRIHNATTEFVREMSELLPDEDLTVRDISSMRIHGVTTDLVRELQEDGYENLTVDDLVQMKIHGFDRWLRRRRGGR